MRHYSAHYTATITQVAVALRRRFNAIRTSGEQGGHAVEYAIGVGLGAGAVIAVFTAYRAGLTDVVASWMFDMTNP